MDPPDVDLSLADPALAGAPPTVRRADAWLRSTQRQRTLVSAVGLVALFGSFAAAALAHDVGGATELVSGAILLGGLGMCGGYVAWVSRRWGQTAAWAQTVVRRYRELQMIGVAPAMEGPGPLDAMVARIDALAGDRPGVRESAARAAEEARRIEAELRHLDQAATGDPRADAALDAARASLRERLEHLRAMVAETYAALAELQSHPDSAALEDTVRRLSAEVEVERASVARRARAAALTE